MVSFVSLLFAVEEDVPEVKEPELPIIPNYLSNPPFPYGKSDTDDLILAPHTFQNGTANRQPYCEPVTSLPSPPDLSPASLISYEREQSLFVDPENSKEGAGQNGLMPDPPGVMNGVLSGAHRSRNGEHSHAASPIEPAHPVPPAAGGSAGSQAANPTVTRQQSIPQQLSCGPPGVSVPAFQPFFFTSTFPVNVQGKEAHRPHWPSFTQPIHAANFMYYCFIVATLHSWYVYQIDRILHLNAG